MRMPVVMLGLLLTACQTLAEPRPRSLVLTHATLIDVAGSGSPYRRDTTIIVAGNRVVAVGRSGRVRVPKDAVVIDASGRFVIPGLWDMHAHALTDRRYEYAFPLFVANGITAIREMGSNLAIEEVNELRRAVSGGRLVGPRLAALTYRILDGPGTQLGTAVAVGTAEEGRTLVRSYKQSGADFVKPYNRLSRETYLAIVAEAKKQKLPVEGHIPFSMTAAEVSDLGQSTVEHNFGVLLSCSSNEEDLRRETLTNAAPWVQAEARASLSYDAAKAARLFSRFARNGTWSCPTLSFQKLDPLQTEARAALAARYVPESRVTTWRAAYERLQGNLPAQEREARQAALTRIVGEMHRAGVRILAGTDTGAFFALPGFSLHDELEELVKAGLTPLEALRAATRDAALFLHQEQHAGTVAKGHVADLVLLEDDPLRDISNTRKIAAVVLNGRLFDRKELDAMLAAVEAGRDRR